MEIQAKLRKTYMRVETNSHSDSEGSTREGSGVGGGIGAVSALSGVGSLLPTSATNNAYSALPDRSDSPADSMKCQNTATTVMYSMRGIGELHHLILDIYLKICSSLSRPQYIFTRFNFVN